MRQSTAPHAKPSRQGFGGGFRAPAVVLLLALCALIAAGLPTLSLAARTARPLNETEEWQRLTKLWQTMLDHSSDAIYNPTLFQNLAPQMTAAEADLRALADRGAMRKPVADYLGRIFHMRYQYIRDCHYTTRSEIRITGTEASRTTAQWIIELQLLLLRPPPRGKAEENLAAAAESNIAYQLTYLYHLDKFEAEVDRRGSELKKKEEAGERVDRKAFEDDCQRRRNLLVEACNKRKLPSVGAVREIMPYLIKLTRQEQPPYAVTGRAP